MWVDYVTYLTTAIVVLAAIALVIVVARKRAGPGIVIGLVVALMVGLLGTYLVRPERFRAIGANLQIVEVDGVFQTEEATLGLCLSIFRRIGPLSFIMGNDLFPGDTWDLGPFNGCEAVGNIGVVNLPPSVESGDWMLCDFDFCNRLTRLG